MLKATGLQTFANYLSSIPEGSLFEATNVNIDRDGVIEPRRGFKVDAELTASPKQLLYYKNTILVHYDTKLAFKNGSTYTDFTGSFSAPGVYRTKGIELNGNFYMTSDSGIRKLTSLSPTAMSNAGVPAALDVSLQIDSSSVGGFLDPLSEVSYAIVWGIRDANDNLILGAPSYRATVYNSSNSNKDVILTFLAPDGINTDYFYRIYRTKVSNLRGGSGAEYKLVFEEQWDGIDTVQVTDVQPDELQASGVALYTNENTGDGEGPNHVPPKSEDIAVYKNTTFFANNHTKHKLDFTMVGLDSFFGHTIISISPTGTSKDVLVEGTDFPTFGVSTVAIKNTTNSTFNNTHYVVTAKTIVGPNTQITISDPANLTVGLPSSPDSAELFYANVIINGNTNQQYHFIGRAANGEITVNQTMPFAPDATVFNNKYFLVYSANDVTQYCFYYDGTVDQTVLEPNLTGVAFVKINVNGKTTNEDIALATLDAMVSTYDFTLEGDGVSQVGVSNNYKITYVNIESGPCTVSSDGTTATGFVFSQPVTGIGPTGTNETLLSYDISPSSAVEATAKALVSKINSNPNTEVIAYYTSLSEELPGAIRLETENYDDPSFFITGDYFKSTVDMFNPSLLVQNISFNENKLNELRWSKVDQPEACPVTNATRIGPGDKRILRIVPLRDSLFIFKEEGIYRLTGDNTFNFNIKPFDFSAQLVAPDSAQVLNNQIYCLSTQGIISVSETGVGIVSRQIENLINYGTSPAFPDYKTQIFGLSSEVDRAYFLFMQETPIDETCTIVYRYNTFTRAFTRWNKETTCAALDISGSKIYLGAGDIDAVEVERKTSTSKDYADREDVISLLNRNGDNWYLTDINSTSIGDALVQQQWLTPFIYNNLIYKLNGETSFSFNFQEITTGFYDIISLMNTIVDALNSNLLQWNMSLTAYSILNYEFQSPFLQEIEPGMAYEITGLYSGLVMVDAYFVPIQVGDVVYLRNLDSSHVTVHRTRQDALDDVNRCTHNATASNKSSAGFLVFDVEATSDSSLLLSDYNTIVEMLGLLTNANNLIKSYYIVDSSVSVLSAPATVASINTNNNSVTLLEEPRALYQGDITRYEGIDTQVVWAPLAMGSPEVWKHFRTSTLLLENTALSKATLGYASDLSGNFEDIEFSIEGSPNFGDSPYNAIAWGGEGLSYPLRTLVPRQKQRCRYIKMRFKHNTALQKYAVLGISFAFNMGSDRAYF